MTETEVDAAYRVLEKDYLDDVRAAAQDIKLQLDSGKFRARDDLVEYLEDTVDAHPRVIHTHEARRCVLVSPNEEAIFDAMGKDALDPEGNAIPWSRIAYFAFRQDVLDELEGVGVDVNNDDDDRYKPEPEFL